MQVMFNVTNPSHREQTMTKGEDKSKVIAIKTLLEQDEDFVLSAVQCKLCSAALAGFA